MSGQWPASSALRDPNPLTPLGTEKERRKRAFSVPIRNCHVMCFLQVSILLLVFSVRLEFFRSKIELYGFGLCSLRGVCAMQSAFRGEDKLTAETEGFAGLIARIVVEREHICLV